MYILLIILVFIFALWCMPAWYLWWLYLCLSLWLSVQCPTQASVTSACRTCHTSHCSALCIHCIYKYILISDNTHLTGHLEQPAGISTHHDLSFCILSSTEDLIMNLQFSWFYCIDYVLTVMHSQCTFKTNKTYHHANSATRSLDFLILCYNDLDEVQIGMVDKTCFWIFPADCCTAGEKYFEETYL